MSESMRQTEEWYEKYIRKGETPEWTEEDAELVKWLKSYDPKKDMAGGSKKGGHGHGRRRFRSRICSTIRTTVVGRLSGYWAMHGSMRLPRTSRNRP